MTTKSAILTKCSLGVSLHMPAHESLHMIRAHRAWLRTSHTHTYQQRAKRTFVCMVRALAHMIRAQGACLLEGAHRDVSQADRGGGQGALKRRTPIVTIAERQESCR